MMTALVRNGAKAQRGEIEWVTLGLMALCLLVWGGAVLWLSAISVWMAVPVLIAALMPRSSLSHTVCNGHSFHLRRASTVLVQINPGLLVLYQRFRDSHLAHRQESNLTELYDDPESNYMDPAVRAQMPAWQRILYWANDMFAGRMVLGPLIGQVGFMASDWIAIRAGDMAVLKEWPWHLLGAALVVCIVVQTSFPIWLYLVCADTALSILMARTFPEHQAHGNPQGRAVIVEDRRLLAFSF